MSYILEIASFTIESAIAAEKAGADRIELCDNPNDGGTTPSYGMLVLAKACLSIPVFPMIRPRGGDFLYTETSFEIMRKDVKLCRELGFEGVVMGMLTKDGNIDEMNVSKLIALAYPMEVTFHRAFDRVRDPFESLEKLISIGVQRILTSGLKPTALDGIELISTLVKQANGRISIMPGSGVRDTNLLEIKQRSGAQEFHTAARKLHPSGMVFHQNGMHEDASSIGVDIDMIHNMRSILNNMPD